MTVQDAADPIAMINERVKGRQAATWLLDLIVGESDGVVDGFWREMLDRCPESIKPKSVVLHTLTNPAAKRFELVAIQFGEYKGQLHGDVPIDRLSWYADAAVELQAYLRSDIGRKRIEAGE